MTTAFKPNIGAFIIGIGFGAHYIMIIRNPQNRIGHNLGPYTNGSPKGLELLVAVRAEGPVPLLKGSWDLVTRVIIRVTILITPIKVIRTLLTKSHDPPSKP